MPGTYIPFPAVPYYPGVPQLLRPVQEVIASNPVLAIGIGTAENLLISALQQAPRWGIFDLAGNQVGIPISANSSTAQQLIDTLASQITGQQVPVLSTIGLDYTKETMVSEYPVEGGGFASYNKVERPAEPVITLALAGSQSDRTNFLTAIDTACKSTSLYNVVTPEIQYFNYIFLRYRYSRRAQRGVTLLMVEIALREVREVTAVYTTQAIVQPADPASTPQANNGMTQPTTPPQSTLLKGFNWASSFFTGN